MFDTYGETCLILKRKLYLKKEGKKYVKLESCAKRTSNVCTAINQTGRC